MSKFFGILDCEKCYKHQAELMTEAEGATILCDFAIKTV